MIPVDDDIHAVLRIVRAVMVVVGVGSVGLTMLFVADRRVASDRFSLTREAGSHRETVLRDVCRDHWQV